MVVVVLLVDKASEEITGRVRMMVGVMSGGGTGYEE